MGNLIVRANAKKKTMKHLVFRPSEGIGVIQWVSNTILTLNKDKKHVVEIKEYKEKRSLDANALFWKICGEIAAQVGSDKDSIYLGLLERYGVYTHVVVKPEAVEAFKREYRLCHDLGEVKVNGKTGHQLQCYFGSSKYDRKQMARLIDGALSELKEMGIEFTLISERDRAIEEWNR